MSSHLPRVARPETLLVSFSTEIFEDKRILFTSVNVISLTLESGCALRCRKASKH